MVLRVLEEEAQRPFFRVLGGERQLQLATAAGVITLRVDRLDEDGEGAAGWSTTRAACRKTFA
jgi:hypothetical protein